jgi:hypothetical protein
MAGVRFADLQSRPTEFLDCTSVPLDAFQPLVEPFEAAFQAPMTAWRLDGKPRTARHFSVYQNGPLPPPKDRLLIIPTTPSRFDPTIATRYALSVYQAPEQERAYVTSVSDGRRRVCDSHL